MTRSTGRKRVDQLGIAAELDHGVAHGGEVDHRRDAGEVLHQHAGRAEGDLAVRAALLLPVGQRLDVLAGDAAAVLVAQQVLEQHLQRIGQARNVAQFGLGCGNAVVIEAVAADFQRAAHIHTIVTGSRHGKSSLF